MTIRLAEGDISDRPLKRCRYEEGPFIKDVVCEIAQQLLNQSDFNGIWACSNVTKHWRHAVEHFKSTLNLKEYCPHLTILGNELYSLSVKDESSAEVLRLIEKYRLYNARIELQENGTHFGCTLLTIPKGLTLDYLEDIAVKHNIYLEFDTSAESKDLNPKIEKSYQVLITNNIFSGTRNMSFEQVQKYVKEAGGEMPELHELIALCVLTLIRKKSYLYGSNPQLTMGYTNTSFINKNWEKVHLVVGLFINSLVVFGKHKGKYGQVLHIVACAESSLNTGATGRIKL